MKLRRIVLGVAIAFVLLGVAITIASTAPTADGRAGIVQEPNPNQHETPIQSVNGKVVAISKTDLTVEVQADGKSDPIDFVIDENTKMDGDIKPGIMATVDYQTKDGKKYATHIMPAEAKKP
jgi:hypothetical protein